MILDSEAAKLLDEQSGELTSNSGKPMTCRKENQNCYSQYTPYISTTGKTDSGGASRFFYTAKADKKQRNVGCGKIDSRQIDESREPENPGGNNPRNRGAKQATNFHPTVKPLDLMEYLCRLTSTPAGGIVLDPFSGSGTTALACINTSRDYIGIEREPDYCKIAEARIAAIETGIPIAIQAKQHKNQMALFK